MRITCQVCIYYIVVHIIHNSASACNSNTTEFSAPVQPPDLVALKDEVQQRGLPPEIQQETKLLGLIEDII